MSAIDEFKKLLAEAQKQHETVLKEAIAGQPTPDTSIPTKAAEYLSKSRNNDTIPASPANIEAQRWNDPLRPLDQEFVTLKQMNDHYGLFLQRIQQQMSTMGGSGEVNFRYLDDVNRATMSPSNDNYVLEYDAATKKVQFTNQIGPVDFVKFDVNHTHEEVRIPGTLCWDPTDRTINIEHPGDLTQRVGQEVYVKVRNLTANTIVKGTALRFSGAQNNGSARLLVEPFLANGEYPSLYVLGVAAQDIDSGADGFAASWGKVRDIDTSAFNVGDVLFVSANTAGEFTNVKPTAPDNVIPIAAVLKKDSQTGEIFVRPTVEQMQKYGRFARTTDQTANTINTGYPISFDDTEISNGVTIGDPTSRLVVSESGFYQFDVSIQAEATSNKGVVYVWFRKNGVDVPMSSRSNTITNGDSYTISTTLQISLDANEYVEIVWAASAAGILLSANDTPIVGPSIASALLSVAQIQL